MDNINLLEGLIDKKVENILKLFFENKNELFHINKLSSGSGVPLATTFRIVKKLNNLNIITSVEIGKFRIYKLSLNKKTEFLKNIIK